MDLRTRIFDIVYRDGPQSVMSLAMRLETHRTLVLKAVQNEWFYTADRLVHIAKTNPAVKQGASK